MVRSADTCWITVRLIYSVFYTILKSHLSVLTLYMPHLVISISGFTARFISINREERTWQIPMKDPGPCQEKVGRGGDASEESRPRGPLTPEPLLSTSPHLLVPGGAGRNCLEVMQERVSSEPGSSKQNQIVHED